MHGALVCQYAFLVLQSTSIRGSIGPSIHRSLMKVFRSTYCRVSGVVQSVGHFLACLQLPMLCFPLGPKSKKKERKREKKKERKRGRRKEIKTERNKDGS